MIALLILLMFGGAVAVTSPEQPVADLLHRVLPTHADLFALTISASSPPSFSIAAAAPTFGSAATRIAVTATDVSALAAGVLSYLNSVNASISWAATGGNNLVAALPSPSVGLPPPPHRHTLRRSTPFSRRYVFNTCTYSYSTVWWDWARWETELDWMALHAINTPLSMLGAEWVWRETFVHDFGLARSDLDDFFPGPAYLPWHWMGNLDGWNAGAPSPLSDAWLECGRQLQHQFLKRARALGMTPVLPAFAGFVPHAMKAKFPSAAIHDSNGWGDFGKTHYVEPLDPLFRKIGAAFVKRVCAEFGCGADDDAADNGGGWFSADLYNELKPPRTDPAYLKNASAAVYQAIADGVASYRAAVALTESPSAAAVSATLATTPPPPTWLTQAWMWHNDKGDWGEAQKRAFLSGPPKGSLVMLDLYAEVAPLYNVTEGFYALQPWIFSTIFNFGGRSGLYGRAPQLTHGVADAVAYDARHGRGLLGIAASPEAIETDPMMYDLLFGPSTWGADGGGTAIRPVADLKAWARGWAARRYATFGKSTPAAALDAWATMLDGPYGPCYGEHQGPSGSLIAARPNFKIDHVSCCDNSALWYDNAVLVEAWRQLLSVDDGAPIASNAAYLHDVADVGVQVLTNLALDAHAAAVNATLAEDRTALAHAASRFLRLINDTETLAAVQDGRLLGQWIASARAAADGVEADAAVYERNARTLVTLWGSATSRLHEYSYRLWGGLVATFYYPRWAKWFADIDAALAAKARFNETKFYEEIERWEEAWTQQTDAFPTAPAAGALQKAREIYARHCK